MALRTRTVTVTDMKRRTTYAVLGWVLAVLGVLALAGGVVLGLAFGQQGRIQSEPTAVSGPGAALIGEGLQVDASNVPIPDGVGTLTIDVTPVGPRSLFVGVAQPSDLDSYLTAVPYDVVTALVPGGTATIRSVPGTALPPPPAQQSFWEEQGTGVPGRAVSLKADLSRGSSVVIMNSVPGNGIEADVVVTLSVPWAWTAALSLLGGGALALLLAVLLGWRSHVAGRRARALRTASAHRAPAAGEAPTALTVLPERSEQPKVGGGVVLPPLHPGATAGVVPPPGSASARVPAPDPDDAGTRAESAKTDDG